jgi:hypothetical protein
MPRSTTSIERSPGSRLRGRGMIGMSDPEVLTVEEVAELPRCVRKLVYQAIPRRELSGVRRIGA